MKTKILSPSFFILIFILASCKPEIVIELPVTQTAVATQPPTVIPTITPIPTLTMAPSPTPSYPTASAIKANAVAFIDQIGIDYSLWLVNMDGSGERKLVGLEKNAEWTSQYLLSWSPDGKWIGYISGDDLWIISPDGSVRRKILSIQDTSKKIIRTYTWSPDSSKIAYALAANWYDFTEIKTGLFDLTTGEDSELSSYQSPATITLSWSPNGRYFLFNKDSSFLIYEVDTGKVVKEIKTRDACWTTWPDKLTWSPNGEWLYHTHHSNGRYTINWICVSGLDSSNRQIDVEGTTSTPVWDKTGNFLYFVTRKTNPDSDPNLNIDERLMRSDVGAQKTVSLLSLRQQQTYDYIQSVSISPDRSTLLLESQFSKTKFDLIFVDIQSLTTTKFTVDFEDLKIPLTYDYFLETAWSSDSQNLILLAGDSYVCGEPYVSCYHNYGSFFTLNVKTKKISIFSGKHPIERWIVSPIATSF